MSDKPMQFGETVLANGFVFTKPNLPKPYVIPRCVDCGKAMRGLNPDIDSGFSTRFVCGVCNIYAEKND